MTFEAENLEKISELRRRAVEGLGLGLGLAGVGTSGE